MSEVTPPQRILVADNNPAISEILSQTLSVDYAVTIANNGDEALDILEWEGDSFHGVILDTELTVVDGWEVLAVIKDPDNGWPHLAVVMLSVIKEPENVLQAWCMGADYYIPKPFSIPMLLETVRDALLKYRLNEV